MSENNLCPCDSNLDYSSCCEPFISGVLAAPTAEALMRSRYTAYTQDDNSYLLRTWHSDTRPTDNPGYDDGTIWTGLKILRTEAGDADDSQGVVEFIASCERKGVASQLHETSHFSREDNQWLYIEGEGQQPQRRAQAKVGRNEPCPCGSGKKYKKCCGG